MEPIREYAVCNAGKIAKEWEIGKFVHPHSVLFVTSGGTLQYEYSDEWIERGRSSWYDWYEIAEQDGDMRYRDIYEADAGLRKKHRHLDTYVDSVIRNDPAWKDPRTVAATLRKAVRGIPTGFFLDEDPLPDSAGRSRH